MQEKKQSPRGKIGVCRSIQSLHPRPRMCSLCLWLRGVLHIVRGQTRQRLIAILQSHDQRDPSIITFSQDLSHHYRISKGMKRCNRL
ncbi:hypothetical protein AVEN_121043-1 [Araneus ventricosus]|uniref:Uncharacterized protein n=1 Tax=Araneus ventricosus TaxID=182803 RepID=A0A4Y2F5I4_ARAVE|nr:hypothetical protein AVEN_121043-1 [Araneus ventricosus]